MKTTKRILSIALSLVMAFGCFSVIPFVASADANSNLTIIEPVLAEGKTNTESGYTWAQKAEKLYAGASLAETTLQVDNIYDSTLKALGENNLITSVVGTGSLGGTKAYDLAKVTDGDIYDRTGSDTADYTTGFTFPSRTAEPLGRNRFGTDTYDATITVTLDGYKEIDTIYAFAHPGTNIAWSTYKIYVGNDPDTLYSDANEVAYFDYYEAYKNTDTVAWSLNGTHNGSGTDRRSEGQIWRFTGEKPIGKYVGYKIYHGEVGYPTRIDLYDIGVFGDTAYTIDAGSNSAENIDAITVKSPYMPFNLKVSDITPTYLYENYADKNSISKIEFIRNGEAAYNDAATTEVQSEASAFDRMTDGKIYDASGTDPYHSGLGWYGQSTIQLGDYYYTGDKYHLDRVAEQGENYDAKFIMTLDGETLIDTFYFIGHIRAHLTPTTYKVFVGNDKANLFSAGNEVALFDYAKYTSNSNAKLNGANYSEGQIWTFSGDNKPQGKYVGLVVYDAACNSSYPSFLEVAELGVCGKNLTPVNNMVTSDTDLPEISSNYKVSVKATNITPEFFTEEKVNNNILKNGSFTATNNEGAVVTGSGSLAGITDGGIDTAGTYTSGSFWYSYNSLTDDAVPQGYLTFTLDSVYSLNELSIIGSPRANTAFVHYEVYASSDEENLYDASNFVSSFKYDGYADSSTAGKLNTVNNSKNSEGQIYTFTGEEKPMAKYVGIKVLDGSLTFPGWAYLAEVNIQGSDSVIELDTSNLNDETTIVPVTENALCGRPYSFKVDVKNGGTATKAYANGVELAKADNIFTIPALEKTTVITVETDRDQFATKNGIWNGLNLNLGSASYGTNIWDGDYVVHETAMFWSTRTTAKLLYPIENIVTIRSYDFKETYWVGEDFEIVDGQLKVLEGSRMPVFETTYDTVEYTRDADEFGINWQNNQWKYQVRVTYTYSGTWEDTTYNVAPEGKLNDISKFHRKAQSGEDTTVLFLGDSISVGCNSSGLYQPTYGFYDADGDGKLDYDLPASQLKEKYQYYYNCFGLTKVPEWGNNSWAYQVVEGLKEKYNNDNIKMVNKAVGSTASPWGSETENLDFFLNGVNPDLVFIGYGMNESGRTSLNAELKVIIDYIREINPDCSVVLVSAFVPNYNSTNIDNNLDTQEASYYELLEEYDNITIAPVNSVYHSLQTVKDPADYTANCYNHPNDFGSSIYASTILATLSGEVEVAPAVTVSFTDNLGNVVHTVEGYGSVTVTAEDLEAAASKLPLIFGYEFTAWNDEIETTDTDKTLKAIYTKSTATKYVVKATDGEDSYEGRHAFDAAVTVKASGEGFSYWKDADSGKALSNKAVYTFFVPGDITLEAVYNDDENKATEVVINSAVQKQLRSDGKYNLYFLGETAVPEGATVNTIGITYTDVESATGLLNTTVTNMAERVVSATADVKFSDGAVMIILQGVAKDRTRYAKLYVTYTLNGETITAYSDHVATGSTAE